MSTSAVGRAGEDFAAAHLKKLGWRIVERNWRCGPLELDIIARHKDTLIFVEVKTRAAAGLTRPDEALTPAKQERLSRAAAQYLSATDNWDKPCRFDLVSVWRAADNTFSLEHFAHAFEFSPVVAGGHASWQPW